MLKARIVVTAQTDVAAELDKIERLAQRHRFDPIRRLALMRAVEDVLADLKQQDAETAAFGIAMSAAKTLTGDGYSVRCELTPRRT